MKQKGKVIGLENNKIRIKFDRDDACKKCGACKIGQSQQGVEIVVENFIKADIGDLVEVEMDDANILKAVLITYAFPLVIFIIALFATIYLLELSEIISFIIALALTSIAYIIIKILDLRLNPKKEFNPKLISVKKISD